jgi:hypothetical protein
MMASKDNEHKYADETEEEAEVALPKKQSTIGDYDGGDSKSSTDDFRQSRRRRSLQRRRK